MASITACSPPPPRTYTFFLEDSIARDGVLARCDRDPAAAQVDIECANARRAALEVQLQEERERREALERESAAKIDALRREFEARQRALDEAAAQADEDAAFDAASAAAGAQLEDPDAQPAPDSGSAALDSSSAADTGTGAAAPDPVSTL